MGELEMRGVAPMKARWQISACRAPASFPEMLGQAFEVSIGEEVVPDTP